MKNLLMLFCLLPALAISGVITPEVIRLGDLEIHVFNERKIQIYKGVRHKFCIDCSEISLCEVFVTRSTNVEYKLSDGIVIPSKDILPLSIGNIQHVINHSNELVFILSTAGASGRNSTIQKFQIQDNGSFYHITIAYDWMQYGHPNTYPL